MLRKLLKYDFIKIFKVLGIFYGLGLVFAIIARVLTEVQDNALIWFIFAQIFVGATWAMAISGVVNSAVRSCVGFLKGMFGDEAYLYRTLPMKTRTVFIEKLIVGMVAILSSLIMMVVEIMIAYFPFEEMGELLGLINNTLGTSKVVAAIFLFLIFFIEILAVYSAGTAGITFGHKRTNRKNGLSVLFGFVFYVLIQAFTVGSVFLVGLFDKNILKLFSSDLSAITPEIIKEAAVATSIAYIVSTLVLQYISWRAVKKGIDID